MRAHTWQTDLPTLGMLLREPLSIAEADKRKQFKFNLQGHHSPPGTFKQDLQTKLIGQIPSVSVTSFFGNSHTYLFTGGLMTAELSSCIRALTPTKPLWPYRKRVLTPTLGQSEGRWSPTPQLPSCTPSSAPAAVLRTSAHSQMRSQGAPLSQALFTSAESPLF